MEHWRLCRPPLSEDFSLDSSTKIRFPREDSNPHKQIQSLPCYHYTTGECLEYHNDFSHIGQELFCSEAGERAALVPVLFARLSLRRDECRRVLSAGVLLRSSSLWSPCTVYRPCPYCGTRNPVPGARPRPRAWRATCRRQSRG